MAAANDLSKLFKDQLFAQFGLHTDKKPTQNLNALRAALPTFGRRVGEYRLILVEALGKFERPTTEEEKQKREVLKTVIAQLEAGLAVQGQLTQELDQLVAAYGTSSWNNQSYSPETKDATGKLFDRIVALRLALTENCTDEGAMTKDVREACGVGRPLSRTAPLDVKDTAMRIVAAVEGPADKLDKEGLEHARRRRAHLEANGVLVDAFVPPIKQGLGLLDAELGKGVAIKKGAAREQLDEKQLLVELANARLMTLVNAGMSQLGERAGIEARDELRDILPKSTSSKSGQTAKKDVEPQPPGAVASGKAGAAVKPAEAAAKPAEVAAKPAEAAAKPAEAKGCDVAPTPSEKTEATKGAEKA